MGICSDADYHGASFEEPLAPKQFDVHCPHLGSGLNYYKTLCLYRKKQKYKSCKNYPNCFYVENTGGASNGNKQRVIQMSEEGFRQDAIAEKCGISKKTVCKYIYEHKKKLKNEKNI